MTALRKPRGSNLAILIRAIAEAYHRGTDGTPKYQPIGFKTGIATATIHLWKHSGVKSARPDYIRALTDTYHLDFGAVMAYLYGPPARLEGDALLASLRPDLARLPARRAKPIAGGSDGPSSPSVAQVVDLLSLIRRWLWELLRPLARPMHPSGYPA